MASRPLNNCVYYAGTGNFENTTPTNAGAFTTESAHDPSDTSHGQVSTPHATWAYGYPNAIGPTAIYDACHSYYTVNSNIMSLGYPGIHNTLFNQGLDPYLASHPCIASNIEELAPLNDYGATSAAYGAVFTSMGYDLGAADINPAVYPSLHNPTLALSTATPVQVEHKSAIAYTGGTRLRCSTCNTTCKRATDLTRHEKKHQPDRRFRCSVPGCNFKGAYRKDKLNAHVKSRHRAA